MPSPIYTFTAGTVIRASEVNANFALLASCFPTTGGTLSGSIFPSSDNALDVGSVTLAWRAGYFHNLKLMDTDGSHWMNVVNGSNLTNNRTLTIVTGDANRTLTINDDVTIGGQNVFATIAVSGQSDVVADDPEDTLTLVAGTGITITTNAGSDAVTIAKSSTTEVTAASTFAVDNRLLRSDGTGRGAQASAITVDDSGNMSGFTNISFDTSSVFSWNAKSFNVIYQAASDGFVVAAVNAEGGGVGALEVYTDASTPPVTKRARSGFVNSSTTVTIPVKKNDYYQIVTTYDSGSSTETAFWVPMGLNG